MGIDGLDSPSPDLPASRARIEQGGVEMWCDDPPLDGSEIELPAEFRGWAYCREGIERVSIIIDGQTRVDAVHGLIRPDLMGMYGEEAALTGGFSLTLEASFCDPGRHAVTVVAMSRNGRATGVAGTITCTLKRHADGSSWSAPSRHVRAITRQPVELEADQAARYWWASRLASGRVVLDAGCSSGLGTAILSSAGAEALMGVESNPLAAEAALSRCRELADVATAPLEALPYEDGVFDLTVCLDAIERTSRPTQAFDELRRVLKPGGILLVSSAGREAYAWHVEYTHLLEPQELEHELRKRFRHVRLYGQQSAAASVVGSEAIPTALDAGRPLEIETRRVAGGESQRDLFTVAAASDRPLPEMPPVAVLGTPLDLQYWARQALSWEERALQAEAGMIAARSELTLAMVGQYRTAEHLRECRSALHQLRQESEMAETARAGLEQELQIIYGSRSWRITAPLRRATDLARRIRS